MTKEEALKELRLAIESDTFGNDLTEFRRQLEDADDDEDKKEAARRFMEDAERYRGGNIFAHMSVYDFYAYYEEVQNENA